MVSGARSSAAARINPIVPAPVRMNACNDGDCAAKRPALARAVAASVACRSPGRKRLALPSAPYAGFASPIVALLGEPERQDRAGGRNWRHRSRLCYPFGSAAPARGPSPLTSPKDACVLSYAETKISMKGWVDNLLFVAIAILE